MSSPVVFTLWRMTTCSQLIVYMDVKDTEQFLFSDLNAKWKSAWTQLYFTDLFSKNRIDFKNKWHVSVLVVAECLEQIQFKRNCVIYSVKAVEQTSSSDAVPPENVILSCTFLYWGVFHRHICQSQVMQRFIVLFSVPAAHKSANTGVAQVNLFCSRYIFTGYLQPVKAWHSWRWLICVCTANSGQQRETNKHCARVCWKKLQLRQFSVTESTIECKAGVGLRINHLPSLGQLSFLPPSPAMNSPELPAVESSTHSKGANEPDHTLRGSESQTADFLADSSNEDINATWTKAEHEWPQAALNVCLPFQDRHHKLLCTRVF